MIIDDIIEKQKILSQIPDAIQKEYYDFLKDKEYMIANKVNKETLKGFLIAFRDTYAREVQLSIDYAQFYDKTFIEQLPLDFPFCHQILVYNADVDFLKKEAYYRIEYTRSSIHYQPGNIKLFDVNIELFTESQKHNSFYNRKIIIDQQGNVRTSLLSDEIIGSVKHNTVFKLLRNKGFNKYWAINKDIIKVCQDCEFRYMCVDARIPNKKVENIYLFEAPCSYNPYQATWDQSIKLSLKL
ncbi:MAG: hypothetical protein HC877_23465 [Thioploca sp.]|nr:hypothetical protein [Thioploca sp.]